MHTLAMGTAGGIDAWFGYADGERRVNYVAYVEPEPVSGYHPPRLIRKIVNEVPQPKKRFLCK
jgi:hypothetical protein